ncbi:MAG: flagellin, partial [Synergistaceae bacterium]|nr:flagellin [Synergistaceae bacterium]
MMIGSNNTINMTYNALTSTNKALEKTTRALSTGLRAAHASDDASGFAISSSISAQVAGVDRAVRNTQDGISLLQTAEGGLEQINTTLQRMRELSVQAANDTLTAQDRNYIQTEIEELRKSIDNFASNTTFNGKRLLDGSSSAIWASDKAATKLKVSGAVTTIDQFGQKKRLEGNYKIDIKGRAGQGEVQKTAVFTTTKVQPTDDTTYDYEIDITTGEDTSTGETSGTGWSFANGVLTIMGNGKYSIVGDADGTETSNRIVVQQGINATIKLTDVHIAANKGSAFQITGSDVKVVLDGENYLTGGGPEQAGLEVRNSLDNGPKGSVEINSVGGLGSEEGTLTATGSGCGAGIGGSCHTPQQNVGYSVGAITINGGTIVATGYNAGAGIGGGGHFADHSDDVGAHVNITINGGNITAKGGGAGIGSGTVCPNDTSNVDRIIINGGKINATGGEGSAAIGGGRGANSGFIRINSAAELTLSGWIDTENGATQPIGRGEGGIWNNNSSNAYDDVMDIESPYMTLEDIPQFYDASGVFLVKEPQTLTITQGNGKSTDVVLYSNDTIENVRQKLNDAIAYGLGQTEYADNHENFVTFVETGKASSQGFETVEGTLVIRSAVAGNAGRLTIASENQDLTHALGLNVIQEATENTFTASVYDSHSGKVLASNIDAAGNVIYDVFGE